MSVLLVAPVAALAVDAHDFGEHQVGVGPSAPFAVGLTNEGSAGLTIEEVAWTGPGADRFTLEPSAAPRARAVATAGCPETLAPGRAVRSAWRSIPTRRAPPPRR